MNTVEVQSLSVGDSVTAFLAVRRKDVREYARGQFVTLELGDSSGRIAGVIWEPDHFCLTDLAAGMVVKLRGSVGEYQGKRQLVINRIRPAADGEYALSDVLPQSSEPLEKRKSRILSLTDKIDNTYIRKLVTSFWDDEDFFEQFLETAAGKLWHHAYVGGLSEHSADVAELALRVAQGYDFLNTDYLIFGGLLHDVGKVDSLVATASIDYTDIGRLVGHICIADHWLCERAAAIDSFPPALLTKLRHLLLSHQGEFETPVQPMMPEAFVVYYCDEIDSKMNALKRIRSRLPEPGWSDYVRLLERFLYFDNVEGDAE